MYLCMYAQTVQVEVMEIADAKLEIMSNGGERTFTI